MLPGWWVGENDRRDNQPYASPERWDLELRAAGFTGADVASYETQPPYHTSFSLISRPAEEVLTRKSIALLASAPATEEWTRAVEQQFRSQGYTINWVTLNQPPPKDECIISLLDFQGPFLDHMSEEAYLKLQHYIKQVDASRFLWVTKAAQLTSNDPRFGYIHGLARTLRQELELDISIFEVDNWDAAAAEALVKVYEKIQRTRDIPHLDPEYEFAFHDDVVHVGRYHWSTLSEQLSPPSQKDTPRRLDIVSYGLLDTLQWTSVDDYSLELGQVEVDIQYVGLNFRVCPSASQS